MNKKLVALAVSAIAAGAASAQTANVTLYGIIDTYMASERGSAGTTGAAAANKVSTTGLVSGGISGSRWGLRGSESLGGGLNAFFNLENGFNVDNGSLGQGGCCSVAALMSVCLAASARSRWVATTRRTSG